MADSMNISIKGFDEVIAEINAIEANGRKVIQRTTSDFKSRGPGWISQEVTKEYNIKKKDVNETKTGVKNKGSIKVKGVKLDEIVIEYKGRLLTPTHFGMTPKVRPERGPYVVAAKVKKSDGKKPLSSKAFLAAAGGEGTTHIPFQRKGSERLPIDVIKTVSVPQMITNETVSENIHQRINTELGKRLEHHLKQMKKK